MRIITLQGKDSEANVRIPQGLAGRHDLVVVVVVVVVAAAVAAGARFCCFPKVGRSPGMPF